MGIETLKILAADQFQGNAKKDRLRVAGAVAEERWQSIRKTAERTAELRASAIKDLHAAHVCSKCEGKSGRQQQDVWHLRLGCLGTGQYFTADKFLSRGGCPLCNGTGAVHDIRQGYNRTSKKAPWMVTCSVCSGSGKALVAD